jgi:hypothetical protein
MVVWLRQTGWLDSPTSNITFPPRAPAPGPVAGQSWKRGLVTGSKIFLPPEKEPLPRPGVLTEITRWLGIAGLTAYGVVLAMMLSDHPPTWPWATLVLAGLGICALLVAWRARLMGGILLALTMGASAWMLPSVLVDWRPILSGLAAFMGLVGLSFVWNSRRER